MAEATVTTLTTRRRNRVGERARTREIIERKAAKMTISDVLDELRLLHRQYAIARAQYFNSLVARPLSIGESARLKVEYDRCDFQLQFALGVDVHGPKLHEARARGWLTANIQVLRTVGIVG